jgi:hypothetical protein
MTPELSYGFSMNRKAPAASARRMLSSDPSELMMTTLVSGEILRISGIRSRPFASGRWMSRNTRS